MLATVLALGAAGLHAIWNLLLKTAPRSDRDLTSWGLFLVGGVLVLPVVVGLGGPGVAAAPWLAASALIHVGYRGWLVAAYRHGDFSLAYPLARGTGALVAAVGGALVLDDRLPAPAWLAIAVVASSQNASSRCSMSGRIHSAGTAMTITPHTRPSTTSGAPAAAPTRWRRSSSPIGPPMRDTSSTCAARPLRSTVAPTVPGATSTVRPGGIALSNTPRPATTVTRSPPS